MLSFGFFMSAKSAIVKYLFPSVSNAGADGAAFDLELRTGEPIEIGPTQRPLLPTENATEYVAAYDVDTGQWVYVQTSGTTYELPEGTWGHIAVLTSLPTAADQTALDANPEALALLWFDAAGHGLEMEKAAVAHFYPPKHEQGAFLQDLAAAPGAEIIPNPTFTDLDDWDPRIDTTFELVDGVATGTFSAGYVRIQHANLVGLSPDDVIVIVVRAKSTSGTAKLQFYDGAYTTVATFGTAMEDHAAIVRVGSGMLTAFLYFFTISPPSSFEVEYFSVKVVQAAEIPNFVSTIYENVDYSPAGQQTWRYEHDETGRITGLCDGFLLANGLGEAEIPARTGTRTITIDIEPSALPMTILDSATGDVTANLDGTVTASSGTVAIDTGTVAVGQRSKITISGIALDGESIFLPDASAKIYSYKES